LDQLLREIKDFDNPKKLRNAFFSDNGFSDTMFGRKNRFLFERRLIRKIYFLFSPIWMKSMNSCNCVCVGGGGVGVFF